jgi:Protein of unknown function (DUF3800)
MQAAREARHCAWKGYLEGIRGCLSKPALDRSKCVRLAYLDEAGISDVQQEPYLVVAGVILNGDQDWQPIERHLKSISRRHLPEDDRDGFIFHAKDIWHGAKYFDRRIWLRQKRMEILRELAEIPRRFHLPIVVGAVHRPSLAENMREKMPQVPPKSVDVWAHTEAYVQAIIEIDSWMGRRAPSEVVMVVAEDTPQVKMPLKAIHLGMRHDDDTYYTERGFSVVSTRHVIDTVHFAEKADSSILQVADTCAFIIKRAIMDKPDAAPFFSALRPQLVSPPREGVWQLPSVATPRWVRITLPRASVEIIK